MFVLPLHMLSLLAHNAMNSLGGKYSTSAVLYQMTEPFSCARVVATTYQVAWRSRSKSKLNLTDLNVIIAVHDTCKNASAKVVYHVLQGLLFSAPCSHNAMFCGRYAHGYRLTSVQMKLQPSTEDSS